MTRRITRQIVGYDPTTEMIAIEYDIPVVKWDKVTSLVQHNENDEHYIYNYPLEISLANDIMGMIGKRGAQNLKYFLELSYE